MSSRWAAYPSLAHGHDGPGAIPRRTAVAEPLPSSPSFVGGRIKVVHLASGDVWGGAERVIVELAAESLRSPDVDVQALLFNEGRLAAVLRDLNIAVRVIPESIHSFPRLVWATRCQLASIGADVVHAHRYKEILATALARARQQFAFVVTVHGLQPRAQLAYRQLTRLWAPLFAARLAGAHFVAVSEELNERLASSLGHRHVTHIPNPMPRVERDQAVPDLRARLGWNGSRPVVGFVGRLEYEKGPDRFVEMAARCHRDIGFVVIGTGSLEHTLRARVAKRGLADRVAFLGEVVGATGYLRQLDVLALPSKHEGLPLVLLEAAACEVPVVAFDVGGVKEVLDGSAGARLIGPGDEAAFLSAVEETVDGRVHGRTDVTAWATSVRARFSVSAMMARYLTLYRSATERR